MAAYAMLRGIDYVYEECPFSEGSKSIYYKELLNRMETDHPGAKLNFYISFLKAKSEGLFSAQIEKEKEVITTCSSCGQPTSAEGLCAFCRMVEK